MTRSELDYLLEKTVADALGVDMPLNRRLRRPATPKLRLVHKAAVAPRPQKVARELHPA